MSSGSMIGFGILHEDGRVWSGCLTNRIGALTRNQSLCASEQLYQLLLRRRKHLRPGAARCGQLRWPQKAGYRDHREQAQLAASGACSALLFPARRYARPGLRLSSMRRDRRRWPPHREQMGRCRARRCGWPGKLALTGHPVGQRALRPAFAVRAGL